jgi:branched-chain amino acid transport system permease protein
MTVGTISAAVVNGLANGMILFLIAVGLTLIFGVGNILNFAHGSLFMLGAYAMYFFIKGETALGLFGGRFWLSILAAVVIVAVFGAVLERLLIRHVYDADHSIQILLTFALVLAIDNGARFLWGTEFRVVEVPSVFDFTLTVGAVQLPGYSAFLIVIGAAIAILMWAMFSFTKIGKIVRAAAEDRETSDAMGINVPLVFMLVFAFGSGLAALSGALAAPRQAVHPDMGVQIIVDSFIVVVIGGLGSFVGTLVAALLVGVVQSLIFQVDPRLVSVIPFALMAFVLLVKPTGLFGEAEA